MGNKDGAGLMYVQDGRVVVHKILSPTDKELRELWETFGDDRNCVLHVRRQSLGAITEENVHPFKVLSLDDGDPIDLYMCHNGTIQGIQVEPRADSYNLATHFLRPYFRKHPDGLVEPELLNLLSGLIGNSKLVFLDNYERCVIVNHELGKEHYSGAWLSTKSAVVAPTKTATKIYTPPSSTTVNTTPVNTTPVNSTPSNPVGFVPPVPPPNVNAIIPLPGLTQASVAVLDVKPIEAETVNAMIEEVESKEQENDVDRKHRIAFLPDSDGFIHFCYVLENPNVHSDSYPEELKGKTPQEIKEMIAGNDRLRQLVEDFHPSLLD